MSTQLRNCFSKGLSLLGLLLWLIILAAIGIFVTKLIMQRLTFEESVKSIVDIKSAMQNALSSEDEKTIIEAYPGYIAYQKEAIAGAFRVTGEKPFKVFEKFENNEWTLVSQNICEVKFKFYDDYHNELYEDEAAQNPQNIKEILVSVEAHEGKEDIDYYSGTGVDLDGDISNGAAKIESAEFLVIVR